MFEKSNTILVKNSPILDISSTINELKFVKEIHVVAVNNEVKELLFLLTKEYKQLIKVSAVNLLKNSVQGFNFNLGDGFKSEYSTPLKYLYEPNSAILKSGGFNQIANQQKVNKLHQHSHLYTSEKLVKDFPGRIFEINNVFTYNKKKVKKQITDTKANITTRNFPKTVAQLRKETKLKDGGNTYLFFTTNINDELIVIDCRKID